MIFATAATVGITPERLTRLAGYQDRHLPAERVGQELKASGLLLRDRAGRRQVIMSLDLLFIGPGLTERIRAFAARELGIRKHDVLVVATHTHFAPPVDATKPALGELDDDYLEWVAGRCCGLLRDMAQEPMKPVRFRSGIRTWHGAVYRRRHWPLPYVSHKRIVKPGVVMAPNRRQDISRCIRLLELVDREDNPVAIIWSAACHPTGWPNERELSSDFIGVVRERISSRPGDEIPILFLQGFAGDLRPDVPESRPLIRRMRDTFVFGPGFDHFDTITWRVWTEDLARVVTEGLDALRQTEPAPLMESLASARIELPLQELVDGYAGSGRVVEFMLLHLGSACELLCVSAEPCSMLLPFLDAMNVWPVGYSSDAFGYWPTDRQRQEGGYEGHGWLVPFGLTGRLRPGLDQLFVRAVNGVANELKQDLATSSARRSGVNSG